MKSMRDQFGESLVEWGIQDKNLVVLDADLSSSTRTDQFQKRFPERFFNFGIAEQNMIGAAIGIALGGKNVVVSGFTIFTLGRAWDFIRTAAYDKIPIKICVTHAGLSSGLDGASHQCLEDIALINSIPSFNIIIPADNLETKQALDYVIGTPKLFWVRLSRNPVPDTVPKSYKFQFGKLQELKEGKDVTVFATGHMVNIAVKASKALETEGIHAQVINVSTLKPLDLEEVVKYVNKTGCAVVAEEHNLLLGLGSQIARVLAENNPVPIEFVGVRDEFGQSGSEQELFSYYGLTAETIVEKVKKVLKRKNNN